MCLLFLTAPHTFADDYDTVLDRLGRLQALANTYVETEDTEADTRHITAELEKWILRLPDQYLWSHRRFKTRPEGEPSVYD